MLCSAVWVNIRDFQLNWIGPLVAIIFWFDTRTVSWFTHWPNVGHTDSVNIRKQWKIVLIACLNTVWSTTLTVYSPSSSLYSRCGRRENQRISTTDIPIVWENKAIYCGLLVILCVRFFLLDFHYFRKFNCSGVHIIMYRNFCSISSVTEAIFEL